MNVNGFWLVLALAGIPIAASAQSAATPPALTDQQRQATHQTIARFLAQEMQLLDQARSQILASLTPAHREQVAAIIGELAISPTPDVAGAGQRVDGFLTATERQGVMAAAESFTSRSRQLGNQLRTELHGEVPALSLLGQGHGGQMSVPSLSVGSIVIMALSPRPLMQLGGPLLRMEGVPPQ